MIPLASESYRRIFTESVPRIENCLGRLNDAQIWQRPHPDMVSIGNLVLHLVGNARQWIGTGLGGLPAIRKRDAEFSEQGPISTSILVSHLHDLREVLKPVLTNLTEADLEASYTIQGFEESGLSVLVHVVEHFSYHVGQISWYTKMLTQEDLGYYQSMDLG